MTDPHPAATAVDTAMGDDLDDVEKSPETGMIRVSIRVTTAMLGLLMGNGVAAALSIHAWWAWPIAAIVPAMTWIVIRRRPEWGPLGPAIGAYAVTFVLAFGAMWPMWNGGA